MTMTLQKQSKCLSVSLSVCLSDCLTVWLIRLVDRVERSLFSMPIRQLPQLRSQLFSPFIANAKSARAATAAAGGS